ncbi:hypothetical protein CEXT_302061 [Caerostris extrusa]|uniref:Uncharacterized protein n=1 Tax=Caerostris extrusa TaxID=172846 RepID=A0AAV4VJ58_CAEEX|nr:hypothetical protein CEXT_302061 [Caerostris extrusa]
MKQKEAIPQNGSTSYLKHKQFLLLPQIRYPRMSKRLKLVFQTRIRCNNQQPSLEARRSSREEAELFLMRYFHSNSYTFFFHFASAYQISLGNDSSAFCMM